MNKSIYNFRIAAAFFPLLAALVSPSIVHADGANEPIPSFYQEAGLSPNRGYENQHANEHIDPFTGKLQWHYVDLHIPGNGGLDIDIQRSYSSLNEEMGESTPVGIGWTMHFGRVMRRSPYAFCDTNSKPSANPVLELGDGNRQVLYTAIGKSEFITTGMWRAVCRQTGGMDVYSPDGIKYEMSTFGPGVGDITNAQAVAWVTRIVDRNGNTLNFTYGYYGSSMTWGISNITASDSLGGTLWKENYTPFGDRVVKDAQATSNNRQWFAGKPQDSETGLSYFGARYYDPAIGRFMGIDAARYSEGNLHSFNRYAYGNNNPLRFIDQDGNDAIDSIKSFVLAPFEKIALMVTVNQHRKSREYGADSLRPINLTWWRGGGAAIGDIFWIILITMIENRTING